MDKLLKSNGSLLAVTAHSADLANQILSLGKNVLLFDGDETILYNISNMKKIHIPDINAENFFSDLDVAEYIPDKGLYKRFDSHSNENVLITSQKCNSSCIMCPYSDNFRRNASAVIAGEILNLIDYISVYPSHLTITGGEPTLIGEGMFDIMAVLKQKFPETEYLFLTNGRVFSCREYFDRFISQIPDDICFAIPLYGDSPEKHDYITRAFGSFNEAVVGMQNFMQANIKVEIRIVVSKLNYADLLNISKFIVEYLPRAYVVNFVGLEMCGNAARNQADVWIDYPQAFESMKNAIDLLCSEGMDVGIYNFPLCSVSSAYRHLCKKSISGYKIVYDEKCSDCSLKEICGGIFKSSYLLKRPEVNPISLYD